MLFCRLEVILAETSAPTGISKVLSRGLRASVVGSPFWRDGSRLARHTSSGLTVRCCPPCTAWQGCHATL